jgi:hypothetical protein
MDSMTPPRLDRRAGLVMRRRVRGGGVICSPQSSGYIYSLSVVDPEQHRSRKLYAQTPQKRYIKESKPFQINLY